MREQYIRNGEGFVLCYNPRSRASFDQLGIFFGHLQSVKHRNTIPLHHCWNQMRPQWTYCCVWRRRTGARRRNLRRRNALLYFCKGRLGSHWSLRKHCCSCLFSQRKTTGVRPNSTKRAQTKHLFHHVICSLLSPNTFYFSISTERKSSCRLVLHRWIFGKNLNSCREHVTAFKWSDSLFLSKQRSQQMCYRCESYFHGSVSLE